MNIAKSQGFTLIELIMVIVIIGILATMTTDILTKPISSYLAMEQRTTLVDTAEISLRRMQRDIRRALPNSIRITGSGTVLELLHTTDGGRYRAKKASDGSGNPLDFTANDTSFDVLGTLNTSPTGSLVIYNLGLTGANAYTGNNLSALSNTSTVSSLVFNAKQFPFPSPQQRFFIVDTPITYRCDTANGQLWRYSNYAIATTQPNPPSVTGELQANHLSNCIFSYLNGGASRNSLVTIELVLTTAAGESARLMHQIHVDNAP